MFTPVKYPCRRPSLALSLSVLYHAQVLDIVSGRHAGVEPSAPLGYADATGAALVSWCLPPRLNAHAEEYAAKQRRPGSQKRDYGKYYARRCFRKFFQKAHDVVRKNIQISDFNEEPECPDVIDVQ